VKLEAVEPILKIGCDAEWVTETPDMANDDDDCAEDGDLDGEPDPRLPPDQIPQNNILSYQYACRYNGQEWSGVLFTRAGACIRHPYKSEAGIKLPDRFTLGWLLGCAIEHGLHDKHLTRWPKHVIAVAHWTRADLSAMVDYASIKRQFDNVQNTYLTLGKPYTARTVIQKHLREFQVYLFDTRLLAPGSAKSLAAIGNLYGFHKLDPGYATTPDATSEPVPYIERMDLLLKDNPMLPILKPPACKI
jgi:hypothetical protein